MIPDPRKLSFPSLAVAPRFAERATLRNGIAVHLLEDPELPVVRFGAVVRAGAVFDPPAKTGRVYLTAAAMRQGGGALLAGDALDEELDYLGADIYWSTDNDVVQFWAWSLRRHLDRVVELFADVLRRPALPESKIELVRREMLEHVRRQWDQPGQTADIMYRRQMHGADHPWGRLSTSATIKAVMREDLVSCHGAALRPDGLILVAAGGFKTAEMLAALERGFGDWRAEAITPPPVPPVETQATSGVTLVPRPVGQLNFRIGQLAHRLDHPDHFALKLMDMILGNSSFNSRLFRDIRTERGLAYAIWSRMSPRERTRGTFTVGGETKYETAGTALGAIMEHLRKLQRAEVTREELALAKTALDNSLAFEFQSAWDIAWRSARYEYYGLPKDWLLTERERVLAVGAKAIMAAAAKHLDPAHALILCVGDPAKCRPALEQLGPVTEIPVPETE